MSTAASAPPIGRRLTLQPNAIRGVRVRIEAAQDDHGTWYLRFEMEDRTGRAPAGILHWVLGRRCLVRIGRDQHLGDRQPKEPTCRLYVQQGRFELPITRAEAHDILSVFGGCGVVADDRSTAASATTADFAADQAADPSAASPPISAVEEEQRRRWREQKRAQRAAAQHEAPEQPESPPPADDGLTTIRIPR